MTKGGPERRLAAIVAMDIVGYSRHMELDEEGTLKRLKETRNTLIYPAIDRFSGRTVKLMGDGILVEFPSVIDALQCTIEIQNESSALQKTTKNTSPIEWRIGLHLGDIIVEGDDIYGNGVNVASRLEGIAAPGGIVLSKQVFDQVSGNVGAKFTSMGPQAVKNISKPIDAYYVDFTMGSSSVNTIGFNGFELDKDQFELRKSGRRIAVEPKVFDLVLYLVNNNDRTVTKDEIFAEIWNDRIVSDAALSSQIKAARKVLGDDGTAQHTIRTVHGRGFRFVAPLDKKEIAPSSPPTPASAPSPDITNSDDIPENPENGITITPSIAVLPFENLAANPSEDYFADGIAEDITTALSKIHWFTVIARNSAFSFRSSTDSLKTIGQKLDANYIVTGSVRKAGTRARITIQVVDTETENSVWTERFDRDMVDIFDLQDEITETVTARLEAELGLSEQRKAERKSRKNLGAWEFYQLGVAEFYKFTPKNNLKCQELCRKAITLDPEFAGAHSRLAYSIILGMVYFDVPPEEPLMDEALAAAKRAIELDDQDANGYFIIGRVHLARCEYDQAIDMLEYSVELNPCLAVTYCGLGDSLAYEGRLDEAIEQFETAIRLSPHDPFRWAFYSYRSLAHLFRGEYEDACFWARRSLRIPNAQYWARAHLVSALGHLGDQEKADNAIGALKKDKPEFSLDFAKEHLFYLKRPDQIATYMDGLKKAGIS